MNIIDPLTWAVLLMVAGCALAILEVFLPSGGILAFLASTAVLASIGLAFYHHGPAVGLTFAGVAVVALPVVVALALKYWPKTAMGKRFLLGLPTEEEVLPVDRHARFKQLVGKVGVATSPMLPSGAVRIDEEIVDAVSQGMPIEKGEKIKVVEVRAYRVVVRPLEEGEEESHAAKAEDLLSRPLEDLGLEPLDDPLA